VAPVESPNTQAVKSVWADLDKGGLAVAVDSLLQLCHEDVELRPYFAAGRTLRGHDEVRRYFRERVAEGSTVHASPWSFEELGNDLVVAGSIRVQRADGSIADAQVSWRFAFDNGLIRQAEFAPLTTSVSG
jgi:ketosteroid isomerase-like protein